MEDELNEADRKIPVPQCLLLFRAIATNLETINSFTKQKKEPKNFQNALSALLSKTIWFSLTLHIKSPDLQNQWETNLPSLPFLYQHHHHKSLIRTILGSANIRILFLHSNLSWVKSLYKLHILKFNLTTSIRILFISLSLPLVGHQLI